MFIIQPHDPFRLGDFLLENFADKSWTVFRAAVAYAKQSGTKHIREHLRLFSERAVVRVTVGINSGVTSKEALEDLIEAVAGEGCLWVFRNDNGSTFHPKVYLFKNAERAVAVVGSGNLTQGGLYTNYEAGASLQFDLTHQTDIDALKHLEDELDRWSTHADALCLKLDTDLLDRLLAAGLVPAEAESRNTAEGESRDATASSNESIFKSQTVPRAPNTTIRGGRVAAGTDKHFAGEPDLDYGSDKDTPNIQRTRLPEITPQQGRHQVFLMTLQTTDVGHGQTTRGTQRRSPEIFIPLAARDADQEFWGWPNEFSPDPNWIGQLDENGFGKMDRTNVPILLGERVIHATIWYNPTKHDIRIRSETLRSAGSVGDIFYFERTSGAGGYVYLAQIIPQGTAQHATYIAHCTNRVKPPSKKFFGYI